MAMLLDIPHNALVLLVGPSGSGKSSWAKGQFKPSQIVSSDACRELVSDSAEDQDATKAAFEVLHTIVQARLALKKLVVVDATNLKPSARQPFIAMAKQFKVPLIAVVIDTSMADCKLFNGTRDRKVPEHAIERHFQQFTQAKLQLRAEPFSRIVTFGNSSNQDVIGGAVVRVTDEHPKYLEMYTLDGADVISDVHGCYDELVELLTKLEYKVVNGVLTSKPRSRKLVFVGDLADRGPESLKVLQFVQGAMKDYPGDVLAVLGNHCNKLLRALKGQNVRIGHGLRETLRQIDAHPDPKVRQDILAMLESLPYQIRVKYMGLAANETLYITHAGIDFSEVGKTDKATLSHCLYGYVDGKNADGFPKRLETFRESWPEVTSFTESLPYQVHGHIVTDTPRPDDNRVYNIDGGCCFGGKLNALLFPELAIVSVEAKQVYCDQKKSDHIEPEAAAV